MKNVNQFNDIFDTISSNQPLKELLSELGFFAVNYAEKQVVSNHLWKEWGYDDAEMSHDHDWANNIHPEDKADTLLNRASMEEQAEDSKQKKVYRYRKKNGEYAWIISQGKYLSFDGSGQPETYFGAEVDITHLKQKETELEAAKQRAETLARESDTLLRIGATIASKLELDVLTNVILKEITNLVSFDMGSLLVLENKQLKVVTAYEPAADRVRSDLVGMKIPIDDKRSFHSVIATYKKSLICNQFDGQFEHFNHIDKDNPCQSVIGVPLVSREKIIGLIVLEHRQNVSFTIEEYDTISKISDNIAVAIDNAILHEKLSNMALTDSLTSVFNRHGLYVNWRSLCEQVIRHKWSVSLMLLDIDFFKVVNDKYGHEIGDQILSSVAKVIMSAIRKSDVIARFGGEEFVVVLPDTQLDQAEHVAQKIQQTLAATSFCEISEPVTISIGIANTDAQNELSLDSLIQSADTQLYKAKNQGRNCIRSDS